MTNRQVAKAFLKGIPATTTNLSTDGETLKSYGWYEIAKRRCYDGACKFILRAGRMYSPTTAKQKSEVMRAAVPEGLADDVMRSPIDTPKDQAEMNVEGELE